MTFPARTTCSTASVSFPSRVTSAVLSGTVSPPCAVADGATASSAASAAIATRVLFTDLSCAGAVATGCTRAAAEEESMTTPGAG